MSDIQTAVPATPVAAATAATSSTSSGSVANSVQVAVADMSQALEDLTRAIQTNATVTAPPSGDTLTLATALGNITIILPTLEAAEQQTLVQQLTNLAQTRRPLTLSLQPGSPPTQAMLLIPPSANTAPASQPPATATPQSPIVLPPLTAGTTVPAVVLPALPPLQTAQAGSTAPPGIPLPISAAPPDTPGQPPAPQSASTVPPAAAAPTSSVPATSPPLSSTPTTSAAVTTPQQGPPAPLPPPAAAQMPVPSLPLQTTTSVSQPAAVAPPVAAQPPAAAAQSQSVPAQTPLVPPAASTPIAAPPPAPQAAALTNLLQPGNEVTLHIDAVLPPTQTVLPPLAANQVAATVIGTGTDGQLILKAGDATLFVKAQSSAPVGSTVIVTVDAARAPPLVPLPSFDPASFQALPQAAAALAQIDPQIMQQMMMRMPQPTEALPAALMLLFSAFNKQGGVRSWLGDDATDSLMRAGKTDLVASLSRDLGGAGQPAQEQTVGQWNMYPIPLYSQAHFQALTLYVHNDRNGGQDGEKGKSSRPGSDKVRFLIDMRLSKLGAMQLDGFVQQKKLDMILRSEILLPPGMHNELRGAYIKAVGAVGYAGSLNFQVGRHHWLTMQQRSAPPGIVT